MASPFRAALRATQLFCALMILGLTSYQTHITLLTSPSTTISALQIFLLYTSSASILVSLFLEISPYFTSTTNTTTKSRQIPILTLHALTSAFYLAAFIPLCIQISKLPTRETTTTIHDLLIWILQANTAFTAISYAAWAASATVMGIEISRDRNVKGGEGKKMVEV